MILKANLGVNYKDAGRLAEALPLLEEASRAARKYPSLRFIRGQLVDAYTKCGRNEEAAALAKEMLTEKRAMLPPGQSATGRRVGPNWIITPEGKRTGLRPRRLRGKP